jgi:anaerobic magnesium-protoporphyrin IX monomethyl ester cyclase
MGQKEAPEILFVTTPLQQSFNFFPPMGSLSIITTLKKAGFDKVELYDIDFLRVSFPEALAHIEKKKPDILAISSVVSTAYDYTKKLSLEVQKILPETTILMGGGLGASAEVILKRTGVEFICTSEGEQTAVDFVNCWMTAESKEDFKEVKGLAFLDQKGDMMITPYQDPVKPENVYDIDWSLLNSPEEVDFFFPRMDYSPITGSFFSQDPRSNEPHRKGKRVATIAASKGCVARCTFCHRFDKGIRYIPTPVLMERIDSLIREQNVGYILFSDENFGTDRKWLARFLEEIAKRDILWRVQGMRVNTIKPESIKKMKEAGCSSILYGMESGSQKMLDVMEKRTTVEQNYNAVKWMAENNLSTVLQIIIGMPGETKETIEETMQFACFFVEQSPTTDFTDLSINFAQALPGTPLYEIARHKGAIGETLEGEEQYLLFISDRDARDGKTMLNFTDFPRIVLEKWYFEIQSRVRYAYINKWGIDNYYNLIFNSPKFKYLTEDDEQFRVTDTGYFAGPARQHDAQENSSVLASQRGSVGFADPDSAGSINAPTPKAKIPSIWSLIKKRSLSTAPTFYPRFFEKARFLNMILVFGNCIRKYGFAHFLGLMVEYSGWLLRSVFIVNKPKFISEYISLRKELRKKTLPIIETDNPAMEILRKGR